MDQQEKRRSKWSVQAKTSLDFVVAAIGLVLAGPLLLVLGLIIKLDSPGPVLYRRRVLGLGGKQFDALKLRTMFINADEMLAEHPELAEPLRRGQKLKDDPRVTRCGRWMRRFSLDELPQLINILRGEMSLVGPRIISPAELAQYGPYADELLSVKPGLTGLWQVSGRADLDQQARVQLDLAYVRRRSLKFDLKLLWLTVPAVLRGRGAY